jgi:hypothetical protein
MRGERGSVCTVSAGEVRSATLALRRLSRVAFQESAQARVAANLSEWNDLIIDVPSLGGWSPPFLRLTQRLVVHSLVRPLLVIVGQVLSAKMIHAPLAEDNEPVEALLPNRLNKPFNKRIRVR